MKPKTSKHVVARRADDTDAFIGERIRAARIMAGISQTELGDKVGVSFQQVQKYEKGANRVGGGRMAKVAEALQRPVGWFYGEGTTRAKIDDPITKLGGTRDGVRLAVAFNAIASPDMRRSILQTAEAAAA